MGRKALIIATAEYEDPSIPDLHAPAGDASKLAEVLGNPQIGDFSVEIVINEPEHLLRRRIGMFLRSAGLEDILILYFSCHGLTDDEGKFYFAATDTDEAYPEESGLPAEYVARAIARSPSQQIVLFLDCCYSARFFDDLLRRGENQAHINEQFSAATGHGKAIIAASDRLQSSYEEAEQSLFSRALVEGLETGDADRDNDGRISIHELYDYLFESLIRGGARQQPRIWKDLLGPLYVAWNQNQNKDGANLGGETWPDIEGIPPSREGELRSQVSEIDTEVEFVNERRHSVLIYWLDYAGQRILYQRLPPKHFYRQRTFVTHPWIVCTTAGEAIVAFQPIPTPGRAVIR